MKFKRSIRSWFFPGMGKNWSKQYERFLHIPIALSSKNVSPFCMGSYRLFFGQLSNICKSSLFRFCFLNYSVVRNFCQQLPVSQIEPVIDVYLKLSLNSLGKIFCCQQQPFWEKCVELRRKTFR